MSFQGKVALITGGGSGMGRLAAQNLAKTGVKVAALDVNEAGLSETAQGHDGIETWVVDVTDYDALVRAVDEAEEKLGPIDRVYNAAAIMPLGKLVEQDQATILKVMDINYGGVVNLTKATLPRMLERGKGDLINFASMAGWVPVLLMGAYNASKFAVVSFTEVLYHENRDKGVNILCVCPPPVQTPLLAQGKATAWPNVLDEGETLEPQTVLDAIESAIDAGDFFVFPGKQTKMAWRLRRWIPGVLWSRVHKVEGW